MTKAEKILALMGYASLGGIVGGSFLTILFPTKEMGAILLGSCFVFVCAVAAESNLPRQR